MAQKFRTKSVYSKSGFFNESLSVGCDSLIDGFGLIVSGVDFLVTGCDIYFDKTPFVGGVPIMLSGEAESPDLSNYVEFEDLQNLSGVLNSAIENVNAANNNSITELNASLQSQIDNLNAVLMVILSGQSYLA